MEPISKRILKWNRKLRGTKLNWEEQLVYCGKRSHAVIGDQSTSCKMQTYKIHYRISMVKLHSPCIYWAPPHMECRAKEVHFIHGIDLLLFNYRMFATECLNIILRIMMRYSSQLYTALAPPIINPHTNLNGWAPFFKSDFCYGHFLLRPNCSWNKFTLK